MLDTWKKAPRCRGCRRMLHEEMEPILEGMCLPCFIDLSPWQVRHGLGYVWRVGRDRLGQPMRRLVHCRACA